MTGEKLPEFLKPYFWDVRFEELNTEEASGFVLKRIIDRGNTQAWEWARERYSLDQVRDLVTKTRDISRKSANFWAKILGLKLDEVPCLRKPYSRMPFAVSN